ncbi:MAG: translation elongation factor 4 [Candidatus Firestonebacteria bacterium]
MDVSKIRNFCIIAHIDHGKSTLADRILEHTHAINDRNKKEQFMDKMDLERERGITIKAKAIRLDYRAKSGADYVFNLIDTPGHVDFTYEVSKTLYAAEGALLVVDASQGVEAQTLANLHLAMEANLTIIPVINKIDLASAQPELAKAQLKELGFNPDDAILASAKEGIGTQEILESVVRLIPPPVDKSGSPLKALIFDSMYDVYRGIIVFFRVVEGSIKKGTKIRMMRTEREFEVLDIGVFRPDMQACELLSAGEVGYLVANIKNVSDIKIGDTVTETNNPATEPLPGYKEVKPMVFCGFYPVIPNEYVLLKDALDKLKLNDASLIFEPESSTALGFGFRCGFLGMLHMEIIQERLEREYNISMIATSPNVRFRIIRHTGVEEEIDNPSKLPPGGELSSILEPFIKASMIMPPDFIGPIMDLCQNKRGLYKNTQYITANRVLITYEMPLSEVVFDFYDRLKSLSKGYASFDYEYLDFRASDLVKMDILVAGEPVDALSFVVHRDKAYYKGRELASKLREIIPRQMFEVAIQASIGNKVIARESIAALRKNVIAKCYGGDITRKRKLLEKQKEGKKRMRKVGKVDLPQEAFLAILNIND